MDRFASEAVHTSDRLWHFNFCMAAPRNCVYPPCTRKWRAPERSRSPRGPRNASMPSSEPHIDNECPPHPRPRAAPDPIPPSRAHSMPAPPQRRRPQARALIARAPAAPTARLPPTHVSPYSRAHPPCRGPHTPLMDIEARAARHTRPLAPVHVLPYRTASSP